MSEEKIKADIKRMGEFYIKALDGGKFNADSTIQFNAELTGKSMSGRSTPETDAFIVQNTTNEGPTGVKWRSHAERLERERDEARELAEAYKEYAQLLGDEINDMVTLAHVHGWQSSRIEQGKMLRDKIKQLEEKK